MWKCLVDVKYLSLQSFKLRSLFSQEYNRKTNSEIEKLIENQWNSLTPDRPHLYNASKFRLHNLTVAPGNTVELQLGLTSYKDLCGTNLASKESLLTWMNELDCSSYMSNALGVGAMVLSADDRFVFLKRSKDLVVTPGVIDRPGGHPEPENVLKDWSGPLDLNNINSLIVEEIYNSVVMEICDEVNIPKSELHLPVLLGISRNTTSYDKPSLEFFVRCNLDSENILSLYKEGTQKECFESTDLLCFSRDNIKQEINEYPLSPATKAAVELVLEMGNRFPV